MSITTTTHIRCDNISPSVHKHAYDVHLTVLGKAQIFILGLFVVCCCWCWQTKTNIQTHTHKHTWFRWKPYIGKFVAWTIVASSGCCSKRIHTTVSKPTHAVVQVHHPTRRTTTLVYVIGNCRCHSTGIGWISNGMESCVMSCKVDK